MVAMASREHLILGISSGLGFRLMVHLNSEGRLLLIWMQSSVRFKRYLSVIIVYLFIYLFST